MKRFLLIVAMLLSTMVFSQTQNEQAIKKAMEDVSTALKANNADALGALLADDYTFVNPQGALMNKTQRLQSMKSGEVVFESFNYSDVKVREYGNTAIVTTKVNVKLKGQDPSAAIATLVWLKKDGNWQMIASQSTPVKS
jgi:uncharacterized protein (TIGR02246 family)